jgi:magnesium-transporting ATPase (P-type)
MQCEFLDALEEKWKPVSRTALIAWLVFYALFIVYAAAARGSFLFIDNVNLVVHESGHLFFGWFGSTLGLWGGTLMELLVPLALAIYFVFQRHTAATAFTSFFFFENFIYIATYMADARSQGLPLVTVGDANAGGHDWFRIFSSLGLLQYDTRIGAAVRLLGWLGMLGTVGWLIRRARAA